MELTIEDFRCKEISIDGIPLATATFDNNNRIRSLKLNNTGFEYESEYDELVEILEYLKQYEWAQKDFYEEE